MFKMALLKYFKPCNKGGLPNPRGSLSAKVPWRAIAQANQEVQQALANQSARPKKKWGLCSSISANSISYCFTRICTLYDPKLHLKIALYASLHSISATATYYTRKFGHRIWNCRIYCIKSFYQDELRRIRMGGSNEPLDSFPPKRQENQFFYIGDKIRRWNG